MPSTRTRLDSRLAIVNLSRGSTWRPDPSWDPPYLIPDVGSSWPADSAAIARFYDTAGGILAEVDGEVESHQITFTADPDQVDPIPNGANFEIILDTPDGPFQIRYGKVVRKEVEFFQTTSVSVEPKKFTDTFPTMGLRSSWLQVVGRTFVHDNNGSSLPHGVGPGNVLTFGASQSAIRWNRELNGDTAKINFTLLNQHFSGLGATSKARVLMRCDQRMSVGLGVEFEAPANKIRFFKPTSPLGLTYVGPSIDNEVEDLDNYSLYYNENTDTISIYKGTDNDPLDEWTDTEHSLPRGQGYRHLALSWSNGSTTDGIQVSYWSAKDEV